MVTQVPVIGILMIVNGVLCLLYGMLLIFLGPFMSNIFNMQLQGAQMPPQAQPQVQQMVQVISVVYIVLGTAVALAGAITITGGIAALRYRSRGLVLTALFFNIVPIFTCYCAPTSLGLMIWGLIVMFQGDVAEAFKLGASGYSGEEIKQRLGSGGYRHEEYRDDDERRPARRERQERDERTDAERPPPKGDPGEDRIREL